MWPVTTVFHSSCTREGLSATSSWLLVSCRLCQISSLIAIMRYCCWNILEEGVKERKSGDCENDLLACHSLSSSCSTLKPIFQLRAILRYTWVLDNGLHLPKISQLVLLLLNPSCPWSSGLKLQSVTFTFAPTCHKVQNITAVFFFCWFFSLGHMKYNINTAENENLWWNVI